MNCSITNCHRPSRTRTWCDAHYRRWLRTGSPEGSRQMGRPRTTDPSYNAVHLRLKRERGEAKLHPCVDCGGHARTWSYNGLDPQEVPNRRGYFYSTDTAFYEARCDSCHTRYDRARREAC